jgi:hypothetical protein
VSAIATQKDKNVSSLKAGLGKLGSYEEKGKVKISIARICFFASVGGEEAVMLIAIPVRASASLFKQNVSRERRDSYDD